MDTPAVPSGNSASLKGTFKWILASTSKPYFEILLERLKIELATIEEIREYNSPAKTAFLALGDKCKLHLEGILGATHARDFKGTYEAYGIARDNYYASLNTLSIPEFYRTDLVIQQNEANKKLELEARAIMKRTKGEIFASSAGGMRNYIIDTHHSDFPPHMFD